MRSLHEARPLWAAFKRCSTLDELKESVRIAENGDPAGVQLRSAYWKALLLFDSLETASWSTTLASSRTAYELLRTRFTSQSEAAEHEKDNLYKEIQQDVVRCMPGIPFFQSVFTQDMLISILLVYCKLNPDLSYRQGMHELVAPIIWVVEHDAIDLEHSSKLLGDDVLISTLFSAEYIEHDAFALFSQVMQNAKKFYEQTTHSASENPLVLRSQHIAPTLLSQVDPELSDHLEKLGIPAQIFLIRWIRLLFSREFEFNDVLTMWDVIFAEDATLEIVDHICIAMLLRIRWELLESSYNEALTLLLHYPPLDNDLTAQSMVIDALALRVNMAVATANRLVVKYTHRAMIDIYRPATPPAVQRNITAFSGIDSLRRSFRSRQGSARNSDFQNNFEAMFQSTAQNILNRGEQLGEQLGIGKAIRSAIEDVHRRAEEIKDRSGLDVVAGQQETRRTSSSDIWQHRPRSSHGLSGKLRALEQRNAQLAQLLDTAVQQLWDAQKLIAEQQTATEAPTSEAQLDLEKLSIAIGQVQYVQIYLQDSTLPLAESALPAQTKDDVNETTYHTDEKETAQHDSKKSRPDNSLLEPVADSLTKSSVEGLLDPSAFDEALIHDENDAKADTSMNVVQTPAQEDAPIQPASQDTKALKVSHRPPLSESAYSWMLGQPKDDDFGQPRLDNHNNEARPDVLFAGSVVEDVVALQKTRRGIRPKKKYATPTISTGDLSFEASP